MNQSFSFPEKLCNSIHESSILTIFRYFFSLYSLFHIHTKRARFFLFFFVFFFCVFGMAHFIHSLFGSTFRFHASLAFVCLWVRKSFIEKVFIILRIYIRSRTETQRKGNTSRKEKISWMKWMEWKNFNSLTIPHFSRSSTRRANLSSYSKHFGGESGGEKTLCANHKKRVVVCSC